jgi:hypothetical protein
MRLPLMAVALVALPALAADIDISFAALEKIIGQQMFTQDGRRYVKGAKDECSYAYLEKPRIAGAGDKLRVTARFSGRSAMKLGRCLSAVSLGDSFDLTIFATPYANHGSILFKDVQVNSNGKRGFYVDRVVSTLQKTFAGQVKIAVDQEAKRLLDFPHAPEGELTRKVDRFALEAVRVTGDAVVLQVDIHVTVR